ncbi:hypothetical protein M758_4G218000 [Ceratodon purpureus]|nr:hypothetical protein M758_4G218000 [Ceratodon purpureus]
MAKFVFLAMVSLSMLAFTVSSLQSGPILAFFNYSGAEVTIDCMDYPSKRLEGGETFSMPLTRSDQSCVVTLKDGEHASATIDKLLPSSSNSGHSVSVDINDTFLFFSLDDTPHHQYVNFLDLQDEQIQMEKSTDLLLWSMENASDE